MKKIYSIFFLAFPFIASSQNVGVGTSSPQQKLEVAGWIELGNESEGSSGTAGSIRYHTAKKIQFHDGTTWVDLLSTNNSGDYIKNQIVGNNFAAGQSASYDITGNAEIGGTLAVNGNVGIGTTSPGAKLEVAGQVKITGGTPATGKVLTSDANGLATWEKEGKGGIL